MQEAAVSPPALVDVGLCLPQHFVGPQIKLGWGWGDTQTLPLSIGWWEGVA